MGTCYSIRGTNGSGKSTVARRFIPVPMTGAPKGGPVDLNWYPSPTKKEPGRQRRAEGYARDSEALGRVGVVGPYRTACGGLDQLADFAVCRGAIQYMLQDLACKHVIAEGLLASVVYGSWGEFSQGCRENGHVYAFCYMQTPLDVCKERIRARQAAAGRADKEINWTLVENKYTGVIRNRELALAAGETVYDLPYLGEAEALISIMTGQGEKHRGM